MKHWIAFFCCSIIVLTDAIGQPQVVDSLQAQLKRHQNGDTIQVNLLNELSLQYQWLDFNESLEYAESALELAEAIKFQQGIATACFRQAHCYWALGDSERAIEKALRAVVIAQDENLVNVLAETYRILAVSYRDQQELEKAVWYIRQSERLATQQKNWDLLARVYNLAGVIDYTRELKDSALAYYTKSLLVTNEHVTTKFHLSQVLSNIGEIYLETDPDKSLQYFTTALQSARETRNKSAEAGIISDVGRVYIQKKKYDEANKHLQEALKLSRKLGLKRVSRHVYFALVDLRLREGKTTEAFNYMKAFYDVRDSLINGSKTRQIVELETRFEKEKQEQRIQLLEKEKTIQRLWTYVLIVGSLLLVFALITIYRLQKLRAAKARQLLETQQALNEKLKETDSLKSRFFANISHEFRTPLALILGPVEEQLRSMKLTTGQRKNLGAIQRNAQRLLSLVNQLLDLSKLEAGKMELSVQLGNLGEFLQVLTASFDSLAEHKQITFAKNIDPMAKPVGFDSDKVEKIVNNILFNAFKFTPAGGKVTFSFDAFSEKKEVMISVIDTGKGIPLSEQANVFSPFYQVKNDGEDGLPGTGLGLSLVNELVRLYGGTITLKSELNEGTRIDVTLPILEATGALESQQLTSEHAEQNISFVPEEILVANDHLVEEQRSILIVEDNAELRNFIAAGFSHQFTILFAKDGREGYDTATNHIPDLIISDVMMPNVNGLDFANKVKTDERTCHIPIILLTAKADSNSRIEGLKTGADDYLAKPFSMEELQVRVQNLLDLRKRLAENLKKELATQPQALTEPEEPSLDQKFILKVKSIIQANISNSLFSVEMLASEMSLSRAQLFRKVKALINISPSELINDLRLQRAAYLIRAKVDNVAQIGYAVGFSEQSYFSKRFRKKYGVPPSEYAN